MALFVIFSVKYFIERKVREAQKNAVSKEKELSEAGAERMTISSSELEKKNSSFSIGSEQGVGNELPNANETYTIEFNGVGKVLKSGVKIMDNVTGQFLPQRTCAIMGPSGAGKVIICTVHARHPVD